MYKILNNITIKFGMEYKPTKHNVVNNNFTISPFGYSVTKPLKQTLDLNVSLGTKAKLTHTEQRQNSLTPNLEAVKHLQVNTCNLKHLQTESNTKCTHSISQFIKIEQ